MLQLFSGMVSSERSRNNISGKHGTGIPGTRRRKEDGRKRVAVGGRENVARVRPPVLAVGRHLIYCFNYIRIYR